MGAFGVTWTSDSPDHRGIVLEIGKWFSVGETQFDDNRFAGIQLKIVMGGSFSTAILRIDGASVSADQIFVEAIFHVRSAIVVAK